MYPLNIDLSVFSDDELRERITRLSDIYWSSGADVRRQVSMILDTYTSELEKRLNKIKQNQGNIDLDNLVKVK